MRYFRLVSSGREQPQTTHADRYTYNRAYGASAYSKGEIFLSQLEYVIGKENAVRCLCEMLLGISDLSRPQRQKFSHLDRYQKALLICNDKKEIDTIKSNLLYVYTELAKKDDELAELLYEHYEKFDDAAHAKFNKL